MVHNGYLLPNGESRHGRRQRREARRALVSRPDEAI